MGAQPLKKFLAQGRGSDPARVVVCAGDSVTHGMWSGDWVGLLHEALSGRGVVVVNAGWSGYLSCSLLRELDGVIASEPDVVTVMIGTNDVMASLYDAWRESYAKQEPPQPPTIETYRTWLDDIVRRLRTETSARVALIDLPPIGEDLDGAHNLQVREFNRVIREVAAAYDVPVLPLNARLAELIEAGTTAQPFDGSTREIRSALLQRVFLRRGWDKIAARRGRVALTDNIHLTDRAAREVADLVHAFVEDADVDDDRQQSLA